MSLSRTRPGYLLLASAVSAMILTLQFVGVANAAYNPNWGAGSYNPDLRCLNRGQTVFPDPLLDEWDGECVTKDNFWYVYIQPSLASIWKTAFTNSINKFDVTDEFYAYQQFSLDPDPDAHVFQVDIPEGDPYGIYNTCDMQQFVTEGGNGEYRYCTSQLVMVDPNHHWTTDRDQGGYPVWLGCHELAHTTGLQHRHPKNTTAPTCLSYNGALFPDLAQQEINHLIDCFPRGPGPGLTATCEF